MVLCWEQNIQYQLSVMQGQEMSRGRRNWKKLRQIILSKDSSQLQRQYKFALFQKTYNNHSKNNVTIYKHQQYSLIQVTPKPKLQQLLHFQSKVDATGKWLWEAQEIAAYFLLQQGKRYMVQKLKPSIETEMRLSQMRVLELGAGSSGLAAIAFLKYCEMFQPGYKIYIELTDGQSQNISFLSQNLQQNGISELQGCARQLMWGIQTQTINIYKQGKQNKFQLIIVCDCLYFQQFHKQLIISLNYHLADKGVIILVNPARGDSMHLFLQLAAISGFTSQQISFNDQRYKEQLNRIKNSQTFRQDKDLPHFIQLRRSPLLPLGSQ